jgi:hypothetical protein
VNKATTMTLLWLCVLMGVAAGILGADVFGGWLIFYYVSGIAIAQVAYIAWRDRA